MPTDKPVTWNCATPLTTGLPTEKPLLPSTEKVTVPPGVLEEVTFAVRFTLPPEIGLEGTLTLEVVRVTDVGTGPPPPPPPLGPPPQPKKPRSKKRPPTSVEAVTMRLR